MISVPAQYYAGLLWDANCIWWTYTPTLLGIAGCKQWIVEPICHAVLLWYLHPAEAWLCVYGFPKHCSLSRKCPARHAYVCQTQFGSHRIQSVEIHQMYLFTDAWKCIYTFYKCCLAPQRPNIVCIGSSGLFLSHKWLARHVCRFVWCSFIPQRIGIDSINCIGLSSIVFFLQWSPMVYIVFLPAEAHHGILCPAYIYPRQSTYRFFKCSQLPRISCISLWSIFSFPYRLHKLYLAPAQTQQGMYSFHKCCLHHTHARQGVCVGLSDTVCIPQ